MQNILSCLKVIILGGDTGVLPGDGRHALRLGKCRNMEITSEYLGRELVTILYCYQDLLHFPILNSVSIITGHF